MSVQVRKAVFPAGGLGTRFLKHIERTRLLVHLVDVSEMSGREPARDFRIILDELASFSEAMLAKPMIVVANKMDAAQDRKRVKTVERLGRRHKMPFCKVSAVTGEGLDALRYAMAAGVFEEQPAAAPAVTGRATG